MPGTNITAFKKAAVDVLQAVVYPVRVDFAYNGAHAEREYVYFGHSSAPHLPMTFRNGGRLPRQEDATIHLVVQVQIPSGDPSEAEARASEIGQQIEETFAADPQFGQRVPGLLAVWVSQVEIKPFWLDDATGAADFVYQLTVQSRLS